MSRSMHHSPSTSANPNFSRAAPQQAQLPLQSILSELRQQENKQVNMTLANLTSALEALWVNRLRSLLTTLGIFIGIAAVISALTLTQSAGGYVVEQIVGLGANSVYIEPGTTNNNGIQVKKANQNLTLRDMQSLEKISYVAAITPYIVRYGQAIYGNQNVRTNIQGVSTSFQIIQNWKMADGLWFSEADEDSARTVAVLGDTVAKNLFGATGTDPIGQQIIFAGQSYRIVGVAAPKGGFGQDDAIFVPFSTALNRFGFEGPPVLDAIQIQVDKSENMSLATEAITSALRQNHSIRAGEKSDFALMTSDELLEQGQIATQAISLLLVSIAAISLTVGGVGIMNVMLVSVTQRTREIGIRLSVGARQRDIRNQFLIEALILCLIGGILGLLGGLLIGVTLTGAIGITMIVTWVTFALPLVVSVAIGLVFGLYPAIKAARLDPVVALRRGDK